MQSGPAGPVSPTLQMKGNVMHIEVTQLVEDPVPKEFLDFVKHVSDKEGLGTWRLDIWNCKGEGVCEDDERLIRFGLSKTMFRTKHLFLHEVAHALHPGKRPSKEWDDSFCHCESWQEIFARLLIAYLPDWFWSYQYRKEVDDTPGYSSSGEPSS